MDRPAISIVKAACLDELFPEMMTLSRRTEDLMGRRRLSERDIQRIAGPLATIRLLLSALGSLRNCSGENAARFSFAGDLAERYLELEGRVKEQRNDLARQRRHLAS